MSNEQLHDFGEEEEGGDELYDVGEEDSVEEEEGEGYSGGDAGETASFSSSSKKRIKKKALIDRLSELPDVLLIHILSYLGSTHKAAATAVLSKRWQYLWTELPRLNFCESSTDIVKTRKLVTRVHRALVHRTANYLEGLGIHFAYEECFASDVNVWVEFAVRNKVKCFSLELHLCRVVGVFYVLPQVVFSCSSLTTVTFQGCILLPKKIVNWQNLTWLHIEGVELHEDAVQKILSGCPVLRSLYLTGCWGFEYLDIESRSLHHLEIADCEDNELSGALLEISAPYVRYLSISPFRVGKKKYRITNTPSLVAADISTDIPVWGVTEDEIIDMVEFFEDIKDVKTLELGCQCIQVLSNFVKDGWQLPESKRECLTVEAWRNEESISGIAVLLESSPKLETLVIQCFDLCEDDDTDGTWGPVAISDLACDLPHLKTVTLTNYGNPRFGGEPMITMVQILLKRAPALEKIVVDHLVSSESPSSTFVNEISGEQLSYPRLSQKVEIVVKTTPMF